MTQKLMMTITPIRRNLAWLLLLLSVVLMASSALAIDDAEGDDTDQAPAFTLTTYAGDEISLSDYEGQTVILFFWASWDQTSYTDAAILQNFLDDYGDEQVTIIGINHFDPEAAAQTFIDDLNLTYANAPDPNGAVAIAYGMQTVPQTVFIKPDGTIGDAITGRLSEAMVVETLRGWLDLAPVVVQPDENRIEAPVPPFALRRYTGIAQSVDEFGFPVLGDPGAPVMLADYSSFSCPFCRDFHEDVFPNLLQRVREGELAITYVPIWVTGNVENSYEANRAALCAAEQEMFWSYADMLFNWHTRYERSTAFADDRLQAGAEALELDMEAWQGCMATLRSDEILQTALEQFQQRAYTGTPTITLNGERVNATLNAIQEAITRILGNQI